MTSPILADTCRMFNPASSSVSQIEEDEMGESSRREDKRVRELEDIVCTLKFEVNGLKTVVSTVEHEAREEREVAKKEIHNQVEVVVQWLEVMKGEIASKVEHVARLEEKIRLLETKSKAASRLSLPLGVTQHRPPIDQNTCEHHSKELQAQKERIAELEKLLQKEKANREKAEAELAEVLHKSKQKKATKKEKKKQKNLGVPQKLILPEAPAPKFWLQTIHAANSTDILSLNDILDGILRPFREDEIWALLQQAANLLRALHDEGNIHGNLSLDTIGSNYDGKLSFINVDDLAAPKFKPDVNDMVPIYDIFGLGVVLWSTSDYLLEDDEEPATSEALCILIGDMTSEEAAEVPSIDDLINRCMGYSEVSQNLFREMIRELERKKEMRIRYEKGITVNQGDLVKRLLTEIAVGKQLKKVPPPVVKSQQPEAWQTRNARAKLVRVV